MLQKLIAIYFLVFNALTYAQDCDIQIKGNILDEHDKSALEYATVYIQELSFGVSADANAYFVLNNLCAGKYTFIVEHLGCKPDTIILTITKSITKNFYLEHHAEELAEIITTASKLEKENTQTINIINQKVLNKLEGKDFASILSSVTGVNQLKTGTSISKPIINGLYGDRILIVNNGVKMETQNWGTEHATEIDPFASSTIKVIKGIGSLEYGTDALAGMVLIEPSILNKYKHITSSISLVGQTNGRSITTSAKIEQGFKKQIAYFLQGTYKRSGDQQAPHYNLSNTGLQEGNFSSGFGVLKNSWDINIYYSLFQQQVGLLKSSHIGNLTDLQNAIESDTPLIVNRFTYNIENPKQKVAHHLAKINVVKYFKNQNHLAFTYSFQLNKRKEFDIRRGGRSTIPSLHMNLVSNNFSAAYKRSKQFAKTNSRLEGKSGINLLMKINENKPETGIRPLIPDYYQYSFGVFDLEKFIIENFIIEFGARYDFTQFQAYKFDRNNQLQKPVFKFHTYAANIGGSWINNSNNIQVQSNISYNSRFPNTSELFSDGLHHGIATLEFGNDKLKPEHGVKWINTIRVNYRKFIKAEASFYISKIIDFIYLAPLPAPILTIRGAFPAFQFYQTDARLVGFDATLYSEPTSFLSLVFRSSIIRGKNTSANDNLVNMPSDRVSAAIDLHFDFKKIKNVHFGMNVQHVLKQNKAPNLIRDYKPIPNAYTTLNTEIGFDYLASEKHKISFSVTGENITNANYRDYLNRFRYYADELGWNLIFRLKYIFS
ncbi:MAG TPA: TonB-dependent receptor [Chitinophagales bacterium]|nr:TonB-dependent receptor [Chitinophagales bacterium]